MFSLFAVRDCSCTGRVESFCKACCGMQERVTPEANRTLNLDPADGTIVNDADVMKDCSRSYEEGWEPTLGARKRRFRPRRATIA
jgi:hypothetical protein